MLAQGWALQLQEKLDSSRVVCESAHQTWTSETGDVRLIFRPLELAAEVNLLPNTSWDASTIA